MIALLLIIPAVATVLALVGLVVGSREPSLSSPSVVRCGDVSPGRSGPR